MTRLMNTASGEDPSLHTPMCGGSPAPDTEGEEGGLEMASGQPVGDPDAWRGEVAARLARYRTRRKPRSPRYPSLLLPFDSSDNWPRQSAAVLSQSSETAISPAHSLPLQAIETRNEPGDSGTLSLQSAGHLSAEYLNDDHSAPSEPSAKVLEFPRSAAIPVFHGSTLADPIFDHPRIVEAPEIVPLPPALGGILIEPVQREAVDSPGDLDAPRSAASIARRLLATLLDGLVTAVAACAFAAIFLRFNPIREPLPLLAGMAAGIGVVVWMAYQFLFVVYTGSTPGFRAARLKLARFDGSPVNRSMRRWRVFASFLSAFSAGLGYLWCFLDPDSLCWHDRITHTYLRPRR